MSGGNEKAQSDEAKARLYEKAAKSRVAAKAKAILLKHFNEAISDKEGEIEKINEAIVEAQTSLHLLRYGCVSKTYAAFKASASSSTSHDSIHPEIKSLVAGKRPRTAAVSKETQSETSTGDNIKLNSHSTPPIKQEPLDQDSPAASTVNSEDLPGYVAPLAKKIDSTDCMAEPRSGLQPKTKRRFVIGNVSKWIECSEREDSSTHKWMLYVRGCKEFPDVSDVVKKVRFFIHQTYAPNNVIDVSQKPFHLIRRGWGEFPARIQIHFKNPANKPVDVVHSIRLDKTYTGLQTLGSETLIDVWLKAFTEPVKPASSSVSQSAPHLEQNFTIVEDKGLLENGDSSAGGISIIATTKHLKRAASTTSVQLSSNDKANNDCKKPRLSQTAAPGPASAPGKNVLKVKDVHSVISSARPVGTSLLKKMH